jgi:hypothetical protein
MNEQPQDDPNTVELAAYAYSRNMELLEKAASEDRLEQIPGYGDLQHWPVLAFDLLEGIFVDGGNDFNDVEEKLIALVGEEYSLRFTILEFVAEARPARKSAQPI